MEMTAAETRRMRWQRAMVWVISGSLVFRVAMLAYPPLEPVYQYVISISYAAFAALALYDTPILRQRGFRLMLLCLAWAVFTSFFHTYEYYEMAALPPYYYMMLFAFCVCYPLMFILPQAQAERAFAAIAASFCAAITALSAVGVYAAAARVEILSLAGEGYTAAGVNGGRLLIFVYPTVSAALCALALLLLAYLFLRDKRVIARVLCLLAGLIVYVAMALTDGRIASIVCCVCFGGLGYLIAESRLPIRKELLRIAASLCIAAVVLAGSYAGMRLSVRAVNAFSDAVVPKTATVSVTAFTQARKPGAPVTAEAALTAIPRQANEDGADAAAKEGTAENRPLLENLSTLQGRTYAWQGAINALAANPRLLLLGSSPVKVMKAVDPYIPASPENYSFYHLHSIFFQTLVSFGLPGLLLFAAMAAYILFHAVRVFFLGKGFCSLAERALPLILAFCLGVDLLEVFLSFSDVMRLSNPWFFLTAGYVVYLSTTRIPKKRGAGTPAPAQEAI